MKKFKISNSIATILITIILMAIIYNAKHLRPETEGTDNLPKTSTERYVERYIGTHSGCAQTWDASYCDYLLSLDGKYPSDCGLLEKPSPTRTSLENMLGIEKFDSLYNYFNLQDNICTIDDWVVLGFAWPHIADRTVTIFIDTQTRLMYVLWIIPDEEKRLLYYDIKQEEASLTTIFNRHMPESIKEYIYYSLNPTLDYNEYLGK